MPANAIIDFEICVTWVDLYDRTSKMSKRTSGAIKALRVFLRLMSFVMSVGFTIWSVSGKPSLFALLAISLVPTVTGGIATVIGGHFIVRTLCPDPKDVGNPNWKVGQAIRRAVLHSVGGKFMELLSLAGMIVTARHAQIGYMYSCFNSLYFFGYVLRMFGWLQYLIYSSRKHLKRFAHKDSSAYFGFSTLGLKKALFARRQS